MSILQDLRLSTLSAGSVLTNRLVAKLVDTDLLRYRRLIPEPPENSVLTLTTTGGEGSDTQVEDSGTVAIVENVDQTITLPDLSESPNYRITVATTFGFPFFIETLANATIFGIVEDDLFLYINGGNLTRVNGLNTAAVVRVFKSTGKADISWSPTFNNTVEKLVVDATASPHLIYACGAFTTVNGVGGFNRLARFEETSDTPDPTWTPSANSVVSVLRIDTTVTPHLVYVGGLFTTINGVGFNRLARIPENSSTADVTWNPNLNSFCNGITLDTGVSPTFVYIGGSFTTVGGVGFNRIARIPENSSVADVTWNPNANATVFAIEIDDTRSPQLIYIGGFFDTLGGITFGGIARIPENSSLADPTWNPEAGPLPSGNVTSVQIDKTVEPHLIYVAGNFRTLGGVDHRQIGRIPDDTSTADAEWSPQFEGSTGIRLDTENQIVDAFGSFVEFDGIFQGYAVRLTTRVIKIRTFAPDQLIGNLSAVHTMYSPSLILSFIGETASNWNFSALQMSLTSYP